MTQSLVDLLLHLDQHLDLLFAQMGMWTYAVIFVIVFAETGLVVTPFLPGDSLLFATGALAARGLIPPIVLGVLLSVAAIAGDTVNYWIGQVAGPRVFRQEHSRFFKREYLDRTQRFFERYGSLTIVLARFVPIVRTFAPFVAGIGRMAYGRFLFYNVLGGIVWVTAFVALGYFFGNLPAVREHFTLAIGVVIVLSGVPILVELWRHRRR
jgi:membrane-associated protein